MYCGQRHKNTDACLGRPLSPDATTTTLPSSGMRTHPELWRRTTIGIRRRLDRLARDQDRAANTVSVNVVLKDATSYAVRDPPHSVGRQQLFYG